MIIADGAIHGRIAIGADEIVTLAGDDVGLALDIDKIIARAGIDRGVTGMNPDAVVTGPVIISNRSMPPDNPSLASLPRSAATDPPVRKASSCACNWSTTDCSADAPAPATAWRGTRCRPW